MITYKVGASGVTHAAHLGRVRVGYVLSSGVWFTYLLRPEGGMHMGKEASFDEARAALERAVLQWVEDAGLQHRGERS